MALSNAQDAVHITTNATTSIGGTGALTTLHRLLVNSVGPASSIITVYFGQSAAGRVIAIIDGTVNKNYDFAGLTSNNGFTFVTSGGVSAGDTTVVFG